MLELATGRVVRLRGARAHRRRPVRRPDQWFAQAHRVGLGAELEALALRAALAVPGRPAGTFLALNVSPRALLAPRSHDALPDDLSDFVIELTEHELFTADERARGRAWPSCAHAARASRSTTPAPATRACSS